MEKNYQHFWTCSSCDLNGCDGCDKYGVRGVVECRKCKTPYIDPKSKKLQLLPVLCTGASCECMDEDCGECASRSCPYEDTDHFHHDGCPSCYFAARRCPSEDVRHDWALKNSCGFENACSCGVYCVQKLEIKVIDK